MSTTFAYSLRKAADFQLRGEADQSCFAVGHHYMATLTSRLVKFPRSKNTAAFALRKAKLKIPVAHSCTLIFEQVKWVWKTWCWSQSLRNRCRSGFAKYPRSHLRSHHCHVSSPKQNEKMRKIMRKRKRKRCCRCRSSGELEAKTHLWDQLWIWGLLWHCIPCLELWKAVNTRVNSYELWSFCGCFTLRTLSLRNNEFWSGTLDLEEPKRSKFGIHSLLLLLFLTLLNSSSLSFILLSEKNFFNH